MSRILLKGYYYKRKEKNKNKTVIYLTIGYFKVLFKT